VFIGGYFDTRGSLILGLPSSRLRGCCTFGLRLLRPGRLPCGGHFKLLGRLHNRLRRICIRGEKVVALTTRPLGRRNSSPRPGPSARQRDRPATLSERQGGLWRALSATFGHLLCKTCLRFFVLHTDPVVRRVDSSEAAALGLFLRGRAKTEDERAPTCDASRCVSSV